MDNLEKEQELLTILELCAPALAKVPHDTYKSVSSLAKAGEWGVGLEILCDQLYEYDIPRSRALYARIVRLGKAMGISPSRLDMLSELVSE